MKATEINLIRLITANRLFFCLVLMRITMTKTKLIKLNYLSSSMPQGDQINLRFNDECDSRVNQI